jgi:hypothetical protein
VVQKTIVQIELSQAEEVGSPIAVDTLSGSSFKLFILLYCHSESLNNFTRFIFPASLRQLAKLKTVCYSGVIATASKLMPVCYSRVIAKLW